MENSAVAASRCIEGGFVFEKFFSDEAKRRGLLVYRTSNRFARHDFVIQGMKVQCKNKSTVSRTLSLCKRRRYAAGDFDVLALNFCGKLLIIPASKIQMRNGLFLTSIDPFRFVRFQDNWGIFTSGQGVALTEPGQRLLFEGDE